MKKKILIVGIVIIAALLLFIGYNEFIAEKGTEGAKEVTIEVIIEKENIDESITFITEHKMLVDLMKEKAHELGAGSTESEYGDMVTAMMEYEAAQENNEYFHIRINGE